MFCFCDNAEVHYVNITVRGMFQSINIPNPSDCAKNRVTYQSNIAPIDDRRANRRIANRNGDRTRTFHGLANHLACDDDDDDWTTIAPQLLIVFFVL